MPIYMQLHRGLSWKIYCLNIPLRYLEDSDHFPLVILAKLPVRCNGLFEIKAIHNILGYAKKYSQHTRRLFTKKSLIGIFHIT